MDETEMISKNLEWSPSSIVFSGSFHGCDKNPQPKHTREEGLMLAQIFEHSSL